MIYPLANVNINTIKNHTNFFDLNNWDVTKEIILQMAEEMVSNEMKFMSNLFSYTYP